MMRNQSRSSQKLPGLSAPKPIWCADEQPVMMYAYINTNALENQPSNRRKDRNNFSLCAYWNTVKNGWKEKGRDMGYWSGASLNFEYDLLTGVLWLQESECSNYWTNLALSILLRICNKFKLLYQIYYYLLEFKQQIRISTFPGQDSRRYVMWCNTWCFFQE